MINYPSLYNQLHYWNPCVYMINSITEIPIFTWSTPLLKSLCLQDQLHYWNPYFYVINSMINSITEIPFLRDQLHYSNPYFYMINSITQIPVFTWSAPLLKSQFLHDQLHWFKQNFIQDKIKIQRIVMCSSTSCSL